MYSLEYETLVQVLHQLGSSGEYHADVPSQAALKGGGQAILFMQSGNVVACLILNKDGQKLYHDAKAQRLLLKLGILDWELVSTTSSKSASPVTPPPILKAKFPQRLMVSEAQIRAWTMLERSVYHLADGTHSIEQIAALLSRPITTIGQIIDDFEAAGVINRS